MFKAKYYWWINQQDQFVSHPSSILIQTILATNWNFFNWPDCLIYVHVYVSSRKYPYPSREVFLVCATYPTPPEEIKFYTMYCKFHECTLSPTTHPSHSLGLSSDFPWVEHCMHIFRRTIQQMYEPTSYFKAYWTTLRW